MRTVFARSSHASPISSLSAVVILGLGLLGCSGDIGASHLPDSDTVLDTADVDTVLDTADADLGDAPDSGPSDTSDTSDATEPGDADATDTAEVWEAPPDRAPGARTPLTSTCDPREATRCFLPWPSSAFLAADATTPTGLRLTVSPAQLEPDEGLDHLDALGADGFSRVTPIVTTLPLDADPASGVLRVFVAEPGLHFATEVPLRVVRYPGRTATDPIVLVGYPLAPLAQATEHLVVLTGVRTSAGDLVPSEPAAELAFGTRTATRLDEARLVAYHAPHRALLAGLASPIPAASILRGWDFTTRSVDDPRANLRAIAAAARKAIQDGDAKVVVDQANVGQDPIALVVRGHIEGLVDPASPTAGATYSVPFRVVIPKGESDYHFILYCHGTSGNVGDTAFDATIAGAGAAKVNVEIDGWTDTTVVDAITGLLIPLTGTRDLVARMRRAFGGIAAIHAAIEGPLGTTLGAATLLGVDNPEAGRHPLPDHPIWAGGSLGGVIGMVYGNLEPSIVGGVLNVPGAGFTHWLAASKFSELLDLALEGRYPAMVDQQVAASMSQTYWDEVDGAAWADARATPPVFLVQMSVGDPIMPNLATSLVATSFDALMLLPEGEAPMVPVPSLTRATVATNRTALIEFRTDATSASDIHGFAATDHPAGLAARQQFADFIPTLWAGAPVITLPEACLAQPVTCDFASP